MQRLNTAACPYPICQRSSSEKKPIQRHTKDHERRFDSNSRNQAASPPSSEMCGISQPPPRYEYVEKTKEVPRDSACRSRKCSLPFYIRYIPFPTIPWLLAATTHFRPLQYPGYSNQRDEYDSPACQTVTCHPSLVNELSTMMVLLTIPEAVEFAVAKHHHWIRAHCTGNVAAYRCGVNSAMASRNLHSFLPMLPLYSL